MKRKLMLGLLLGLLCLTAKAGEHHACKRWGQNGHRIVAQIAYDNLSEKVKKKVDEALGDEYLAQVATWPDFIRSETSWDFTKPWHYITIDPDKTVEEVMQEAAGNNSIDNVLEAIALMQGILQDNKADIQMMEDMMAKNNVESLNGSLETTALAFLIHFIGDVHQPMHVGKNEDLGGNKISVLFFDDRSNLHSVWDQGMIENEGLDFKTFSGFIDKHHRNRKQEWENAVPVTWAEESVAHREDIYNTLYNNTDRDSGLPSMSYNYQHDFIPVVEERLAAAGYRAAAVLEELY
ncbi:S1/P1 nuclease [Roseivirga sp. BDSF3-8]|uniref:S1/P1 nuclease n=1 Tax=Roseivirga sp. BDSF3-8 TaxID=3241598 RepID=UPI0035322D94